jgi:hypothetical protein
LVKRFFFVWSEACSTAAVSALVLFYFFYTKGTKLEVRLGPPAAVKLLTNGDRLLGTLTEFCCKIASKKQNKRKDLETRVQNSKKKRTTLHLSASSC